ncbi:hypothetical protein P167DRAFT_179294 [Morchella conica CCBAS932]|uniref:Uncharacterized protein n=1 Tax=Morchella conica CCBAS932 TaxID=1392247 RepID=A0A3N4KMS8_9PEZI|nr:hypothetical protein P167DRAFT_179294 [Morchella conica CCBAS932]
MLPCFQIASAVVMPQSCSRMTFQERLHGAREGDRGPSSPPIIYEGYLSFILSVFLFVLPDNQFNLKRERSSLFYTVSRVRLLLGQSVANRIPHKQHTGRPCGQDSLDTN